MQTLVDETLNRNLIHPTTCQLPFKCDVSMSKEDGCWLGTATPNASDLKRIVETALAHIVPSLDLHVPTSSPGIEISFLFSCNAQIQILNKEYRAKNRPTNVLSFPQAELSTESLKEALLFEESLILGDIAFAEETIRDEANEQNKAFSDHLTHLIVHGVLHLMGYDHIEEDEANQMEALEIEILEKLNIKNPYFVSDTVLKASLKK